MGEKIPPAFNFPKARFQLRPGNMVISQEHVLSAFVVSQQKLIISPAVAAVERKIQSLPKKVLRNVI